MSYVCLIMQITSKYIYTYICASYELNGINSAVRSIGIHTHYIINIYPLTNISATLYMHVPLHCFCSENTDLTSMHALFQKQENAPSIYHAIAICFLATNMPLPCHIHAKCANYLLASMGKYNNIYATCDVTMIKTVVCK